MNKHLRVISLLLLFSAGTRLKAQAQTGGVGIGTPTPDGSALLDLTSSTKGLLPPRLTQAQRDAIVRPAVGLTIFNLDAAKLNTWNGFFWTEAVQGLPPGPGTQTATFNYTGSPQTFTVPAGITSLQVDLAGARGRTIDNCTNCFRGGRGGRVQATLAVTPGQVLTIVVGGDRGYNPSLLYQDGGYNGGGRGSEPGGGATDIRIGGTGLPNRVLVAGGGGGAGTLARGGPGGGLTGGTSTATNGSTPANNIPGGGGTQSAGGADGTPPQQFCYCTSIPADPGQGASMDGSGGSRSAAGGGGGYYGGGASYGEAGAGGGSSYADPATTSSVVHTQGYQNGTGYVRLSFTFQPEAPTISLSNATTSQAAGSVIFSDGSKLAGNNGQFYWNNSTLRLGIGTNSPQAALHVAGTARFDALAGSGSRMLTTDNTGNLGTQALPTDAQQLSISGSTISLTGGGSVTLPPVPSSADNLGNHSATQDLVLNDQSVRLRGATDNNHQLRYSSSVNGPQLFGYNGGELGYYQGTYTPVLRWSDAGNVGIGTATPQGRFDVASGSVRLPGGGGGDTWFNFAGNNQNYLRGTTILADAGGNVGIGTASPSQKLEVAGSVAITNSLAVDKAGSNNGTLDGQNGLLFGAPGTGEGIASTRQPGTNRYGLDLYTGYVSRLRVGNNGNVGVGTAGAPAAPLEIQRDDASAYLLLHDPGNNYFSFGQDQAASNNIKISDGNGFGGTNYLTIQRSNGNVGIGGQASPQAKLDVQGGGSLGSYSFAFYASNGGNPFTGNTSYNGSDVSIRASGRIVATEFNATSDRRLKTVVGLSDKAADLALLTKLRITDYTMRDQAQYGSRPFKKVIAQEVEEVFPQAVSQHAGFLPDVYALATTATAEGDSLLRLILPAPVGGAKPGQRVKLIGPEGETIGSVKAADGRALLVRGARQLAGQQVFVFGLEHADVRTVDYEALAMLNVSATQELARLVAELRQQNAALKADAAGRRAELLQLKAEASAQTTGLAQRLQALENMLGAKASVR